MLWSSSRSSHQIWESYTCRKSCRQILTKNNNKEDRWIPLCILGIYMGKNGKYEEEPKILFITFWRDQTAFQCVWNVHFFYLIKSIDAILISFFNDKWIPVWMTKGLKGICEPSFIWPFTPLGLAVEKMSVAQCRTTRSVAAHMRVTVI